MRSCYNLNGITGNHNSKETESCFHFSCLPQLCPGISAHTVHWVQTPSTLYLGATLADVYRTNVLSLLLCVCRSFNIWMFSSCCENTKWLMLCLGSAAWARYWQTGNPWTVLTPILLCDSYFNWLSDISVLPFIRTCTAGMLYCWQSTLIGFIFVIPQTHCLMKWFKLFETRKCFGVVFYTDVYIETNHCNNCNSF